MPSLTIHIAIAKEYYKKNKLKIDNYDDFISGTIAPDIINKNKNISHYGIWNKHNAYIDFEKFLNDEKVDLLTSYWKGYFLHLIVDYYFYNYAFKEEHANAINSNDTLYNDYYFLNYDLIKENNSKHTLEELYLTLLKLGNTYCLLENYDESLKYYELLSNVSLENGNDYFRLIAIQKLSMINILKKKFSFFLSL